MHLQCMDISMIQIAVHGTRPLPSVLGCVCCLPLFGVDTNGLSSTTHGPSRCPLLHVGLTSRRHAERCWGPGQQRAHRPPRGVASRGAWAGVSDAGHKSGNSSPWLSRPSFGDTALPQGAGAGLHLAIPPTALAMNVPKTCGRADPPLRAYGQKWIIR